jgi:hypothetical protein
MPPGLEIELDRGYWRCAADQRIAFSGWVQRLWRVGEFAFDQAAFAVVAYPRTAGPAGGNGAGFDQLEQAAEACVPWHGETASQERHHGSATRGTVRTMRQGRGDTGDARRESGRRPEHFDVDPGPRNAPCRQAYLEILEKAGRATQVEVGIPGNPDFLEQQRREMAWPIEVVAGPVFRRRPAVGHAAMGRRECREQIVRLLGKRMVRPVAGCMQPPNRPGRHGVHGGRAVQHRQHRRDADTGADEHDLCRAGRQRERAARSADLQATARPDALVEKAAARPCSFLTPIR